MPIIEIGLFRTIVVVEIDEGDREFTVSGLPLPTTEDYHVSGTPEFSATWWIKPGTKTTGGFTGVLSDDAPVGGTRLVLMIAI